MTLEVLGFFWGDSQSCIFSSMGHLDRLGRVRSRRLATGDLLGIPKWLGGQEDSTQAGADGLSTDL